MVFEFVLPRVIQGVKASFGKLKEFIKRKWGRGIEIDIPDTKPDTDPELDISSGDDTGLPGGAMAIIRQAEEIHPVEKVLLREIKETIMISGKKLQTSMGMILLNSSRHLEMTVRTSSGDMVMMQ